MKDRHGRDLNTMASRSRGSETQLACNEGRGRASRHRIRRDRLQARQQWLRRGHAVYYALAVWQFSGRGGITMLNSSSFLPFFVSGATCSAAHCSGVSRSPFRARVRTKGTNACGCLQHGSINHAIEVSAARREG